MIKSKIVSIACLICAVIAVAVSGNGKSQSKPVHGQPASSPADVVEQIKELGGTVTTATESDPASPVVGVYLGDDKREIAASDIAMLKAFTSLRRLGLHGKIGEGGFKKVGALFSLESLGLSFTNVTDEDLHELRHLFNLKKLFLDYTQITEAGIKALPHLGKLQKLHLNHVKITLAAAGELAKIESLRDLRLEGSGISDAEIAKLAELRELQILILSDTKISDAGLAKISQMAALKGLFISDVPTITRNGIKALQRMNSLEVLSVGPRMDDECVGEIVEIKSLRTLLSEGPISDVGLLKLQRLKNLKEVQLVNPRITERGVIELKKIRPFLRIHINVVPPDGPSSVR